MFNRIVLYAGIALTAKHLRMDLTKESLAFDAEELGETIQQDDQTIMLRIGEISCCMEFRTVVKTGAQPSEYMFIHVDGTGEPRVYNYEKHDTGLSVTGTGESYSFHFCGKNRVLCAELNTVTPCNFRTWSIAYNSLHTFHVESFGITSYRNHAEKTLTTNHALPVMLYLGAVCEQIENSHFTARCEDIVLMDNQFNIVAFFKQNSNYRVICGKTVNGCLCLTIGDGRAHDRYRFEIDMPSSSEGNVYDVSMYDGSALLHNKIHITNYINAGLISKIGNIARLLNYTIAGNSIHFVQ